MQLRSRFPQGQPPGTVDTSDRLTLELGSSRFRKLLTRNKYTVKLLSRNHPNNLSIRPSQIVIGWYHTGEIRNPNNQWYCRSECLPQKCCVDIIFCPLHMMPYLNSGISSSSTDTDKPAMTIADLTHNLFSPRSLNVPKIQTRAQISMPLSFSRRWNGPKANWP